jgi:hypothetical protein
MSFNSSIPLGTDAMIKSQGQLRSNFQAINAVFSENHVMMNQDEQGMHNMLNFRPQTIDPTTSATQIALYTKLISSIPMLFFAPSSSQTPIQLTAPSISTGLQSTNPDVYKADQFSFIAGPFIVYGGLITGATNGQVKILSPPSTLLYANVLSIFKKDDSLSIVTAILASSFTIGLSPNTPAQDIYYFAIGKP